MKPLLISLIILCSLPAVRETLASPPNVLIIYTDDQGALDLGCYGSKDLHTPNIDNLARTGVRFLQMYAPSAICSASRAGLMTGRFPARAGVPGNVSSEKGQPGMPTDEITIAELLKGAGYTTAHVGKWHLGYTVDTMPNAQGFDASYGHMGGCIDNYSHFFFWDGPNRHDLWRNGEEIWEDGVFFGDAMVREVTQAFDNAGDRPLFLYWAINWPHYPLQGTAKWRDTYKNLDSPRDMYAAFVSSLDELVGRVVSHLEETGARDKTLIIFQSDHGHSTEDRAFSGGGNAGPWRGAKGCLFEGGVRVPSIASLPGTLPENVFRRHLVTGCDWLPTIAEICGVPVPASHHLDGKSIFGVLQDADAPSPHENFYWQLGKADNAQWAVREGDWKLLGNPEDKGDPGITFKLDPLFLVNLADDESESINRAADHPEIVQRLQALQRRHAVSIAESNLGR